MSYIDITATVRGNSLLDKGLSVSGIPAAYRCTVLAVDDAPEVLQLLREQIGGEFDLVCCRSAEDAKQILAARSIDVVLTDQALPGQSGVQLLELVCLHSPQSYRILMTGLHRFEDAVDAINCGRVHRYLFKPWKPEQLLHTLRQAARNSLLERSHEQLLQELRRFNLELERKVHQRTLELEEANRLLHQRNLMLKRMALTDSLTALPNRRAVERLARNELHRRSRYPAPAAIAYVDIDHFKDVNTRFLHDGGDHALKWLARALSQAVRTVDTVGRVGGEEFMVVAPETDFEGAAVLAERMRETVETGHTSFGGETIRLTISVGVAVVPADARAKYDKVRHEAASALKEAKSTGRNRCVVRVVEAHPVAG